MISITQSMTPNQRSTLQSTVNPREFGPNDWQFDINRSVQNWAPTMSNVGNDNMFTRNEPHRQIKNGMFNPLTGTEPIYGQVNYFLNPLQQEQTNSHTSAYANQNITRIAWSTNAERVMANPAFSYPYPKWQNTYTGARK